MESLRHASLWAVPLSQFHRGADPPPLSHQGPGRQHSTVVFPLWPQPLRLLSSPHFLFPPRSSLPKRRDPGTRRPSRDSASVRIGHVASVTCSWQVLRAKASEGLHPKVCTTAKSGPHFWGIDSGLGEPLGMSHTLSRVLSSGTL